jgi:hypothetical protein
MYLKFIRNLLTKHLKRSKHLPLDMPDDPLFDITSTICCHKIDNAIFLLEQLRRCNIKLGKTRIIFNGFSWQRNYNFLRTKDLAVTATELSKCMYHTSIEMTLFTKTVTRLTRKMLNSEYELVEKMDIIRQGSLYIEGITKELKSLNITVRNNEHIVKLN